MTNTHLALADMREGLLCVTCSGCPFLRLGWRLRSVPQYYVHKGVLHQGQKHEPTVVEMKKVKIYVLN